MENAGVELEERLETLGWGTLLLVIGTIWLMPEESVPPGSWLIAAGLILLGINVIRRVKRIPTSGFSTVVGLVALFAGLRALLDLDLPLFPVALIVMGGWILLKSMMQKGSAGPLVTIRDRPTHG